MPSIAPALQGVTATCLNDTCAAISDAIRHPHLADKREELESLQRELLVETLAQQLRWVQDAVHDAAIDGAPSPARPQPKETAYERDGRDLTRRLQAALRDGAQDAMMASAG